eukprot:tig00021038_g17568.t1
METYFEAPADRSSLSKSGDGLAMNFGPPDQLQSKPHAVVLAIQRARRRSLLARYICSKLFRTVFFVSLFPFFFGYLYLAAVWDVQGHLHSAVLSGVFRSDASAVRQRLGWSEGGAGGGGREEALGRVRSGELFAALVVPASFTEDFLSAFGPPAGYRTPALELIYAEGRSMTTMDSVTRVVDRGAAALATNLIQQLVSANATGLVRSAQLFATPVAYARTNLHPVRFFGQNFASYVTYMVLWIGSMGVVMLMNRLPDTGRLPAPSSAPARPASARAIAPSAASASASAAAAARLVLVGDGYMAEQQPQQGPPPPPPAPESGLSFWRDLAARASISLLVLLVPSALLVAIYAEQGGTVHTSFARLAFWNWYCSWAFLSFNALLAQIMGWDNFTIVGTFFLIYQFASSGGIFSELDQPGGYLSGRGWPFYYAVRGARHHMFGALEGLEWENALVVGAWALGPALLALLVRRVPRLNAAKAAFDVSDVDAGWRDAEAALPLPRRLGRAAPAPGPDSKQQQQQQQQPPPPPPPVRMAELEGAATALSFPAPLSDAV